MAEAVSVAAGTPMKFPPGSSAASWTRHAMPLRSSGTVQTVSTRPRARAFMLHCRHHHADGRLRRRVSGGHRRDGHADGEAASGTKTRQTVCEAGGTIPATGQMLGTMPVIGDRHQGRSGPALLSKGVMGRPVTFAASCWTV